MKKIALLGMLAGVAGTLCAQETPRFAFNVGAGFTKPVGATDRQIDTGWNVRGGAGINFGYHVGLLLNAGYDSMGIRSDVLNNLGFGGGNLNVFSLTLDPIVHLLPKGPVDFYITGGGGYFRQEQQFTNPGVATATFFDPFFGFYPATFGTNVVVSDYSVNKPGVDVGAGVAFGSKWGGKFFAEAKYVHIYNGQFHTDYIPVTFGFRR